MLVTLPLEMTLSGAPGVETIRSVSEIGLSVVNIEFGWSADIYRARQIVQERIANVRTPYESKLAPITTLLGQIAMIGMWSESEETSPMDVRTLADWTVRRKLLQVPGVAQVIVMGGERRQFQVLIDPHQLHQFDVSLEEVRQALQAGNLNVSGGYIDDGGRELLIRGIGRIESLSEIEQLVVKRQATRSVLVGDISRVIAGPQPKRGDASINGRDAVVLTVQKQPGIDTRAITQHIREALDDLRPRLPADIALEMTYEQRQFIDFSVNNVVEAIRDGALLVVIVLVIFLLNIRATLITLTAIPLSLLATFLVFKWYGLTINVMTLGGIAIALGELVDDAIVESR
jgi:Cu/Ag efflux pump CusA